jgi:hypothetical protein
MITNIRNGPPVQPKAGTFGAAGIAFVGMQIRQQKPLTFRVKRFLKGLMKHVTPRGRN